MTRIKKVLPDPAATFRNWQMPSNITLRSPKQNFNSGLIVWKIRTEIDLRPHVNYGLHCADCSYPVHLGVRMMYRILSEFNKFWKYGTFLWFSLHRFSLNSHLLNGVSWSHLVPNLTQIGQEIWKVRVEVHLRPSVKYGFYLSDFSILGFFSSFLLLLLLLPFARCTNSRTDEVSI